jgi:BASS family bile acid:Na+ symporter
VSYSVSLTTSATLLSPLVVPAALWLLLGSSRQIGQQIDPIQTGAGLLVQVVLPVLAGHLLARRYAAFGRALRRLGPIVANVAILWIIASVVGLNRDRLAETTPRLLAALLLVNLLGYAAGYAAATLLRLPGAMRRALTLEIGMQNAGLGTVLALQLFPESPAVAIPTAAYTFGCMLTGTLLAQVWSHADRRDA